MAKLLNTPYPFPLTHYDDPDWFEKEQKAWREIEEKHDLAGDSCVGYVMRFSVADGYACYLVTRDAPLTLQYIPIGDNYQVEDYVIRGLSLSDVQKRRSFDRLWCGAMVGKR